MKKSIIAVTLILFVSLTFGCVDNTAKNETAPPAYERNMVVCPNPDCPLHESNGYIYFDGNGYSTKETYEGMRPIDAEMTDRGLVYLCQVCGEVWRE